MEYFTHAIILNIIVVPGIYALGKVVVTLKVDAKTVSPHFMSFYLFYMLFFFFATMYYMLQSDAIVTVKASLIYVGILLLPLGYMLFFKMFYKYLR